ncbi:SoxR reducing system RseC family protein [SAR92 clade bacterium H455]|uniref:SoxR reducing system RseC family protein n=1 Tax=SAR92 clade bacterium H455 TaxID=2974818 RepID=A0ABY5TL82_9GAMM|nr:SoxR reducing system RseC family protein [SAR92 clade bacterium H455]
MILETGVVVAVESDGLWVETIQKSACEVCVAEKGCGQKFLSKLAGKTVSIRVLRNKRSSEEFTVGQSVTIGIPEDIIVMASLLVYLLPIFTAIGGAWLFSDSDWQAVGGAFGGLLLGGLLVNLHSVRKRDDVRFNPVLMEEQIQPNILNFQH